MDIPILLTTDLVNIRNNLLNIAMGMIFSLLIFLSPQWLMAVEKTEPKPPVALQGDLQLPENYVEQKKILDARSQVIPTEASKTTSPGAFGGKILEYHLADIIKNNEFKPLESVKSLEQSVNRNTELDTDFIKIKSKVDLNRLKAEMDIDTFVHTKMWTEDSFKTLRTQMKLYDLESGLISIENKTNQEDTRTYLNLEKTW